MKAACFSLFVSGFLAATPLLAVDSPPVIECLDLEGSYDAPRLTGTATVFFTGGTWGQIDTETTDPDGFQGNAVALSSTFSYIRGLSFWASDVSGTQSAAEIVIPIPESGVYRIELSWPKGLSAKGRLSTVIPPEATADPIEWSINQKSTSKKWRWYGLAPFSSSEGARIRISGSAGRVLGVDGVRLTKVEPVVVALASGTADGIVRRVTFSSGTATATGTPGPGTGWKLYSNGSRRAFGSNIAGATLEVEVELPAPGVYAVTVPRPGGGYRLVSATGGSPRVVSRAVEYKVFGTGGLELSSTTINQQRIYDPSATGNGSGNVVAPRAMFEAGSDGRVLAKLKVANKDLDPAKTALFDFVKFEPATEDVAVLDIAKSIGGVGRLGLVAADGSASKWSRYSGGVLGLNWFSASAWEMLGTYRLVDAPPGRDPATFHPLNRRNPKEWSLDESESRTTNLHPTIDARLAVPRAGAYAVQIAYRGNTSGSIALKANGTPSYNFMSSSVQIELLDGNLRRLFSRSFSQQTPPPGGWHFLGSFVAREGGDLSVRMKNLAPPPYAFPDFLPYDPTATVPLIYPAFPGAPTRIIRYKSVRVEFDALRLTALPLIDSDHDGLPDAWETIHYGNLNSENTSIDGDTIPDGREYLDGLDPNENNGDSDTDGDGKNDEDEYSDGTDPNDPDPDHDGWTNLQERILGGDMNRREVLVELATINQTELSGTHTSGTKWHVNNMTLPAIGQAGAPFSPDLKLLLMANAVRALGFENEKYPVDDVLEIGSKAIRLRGTDMLSDPIGENPHQIAETCRFFDVTSAISPGVNIPVKAYSDIATKSYMFPCKLMALLPVQVITINTFIPHNNVDDPGNMNPFGNDHVFEGDNRMSGTPARATWNKDGSHRTQQRFNVIPFRNMGDADGLEDNAYANDPDGVKNDSWLNHVGATHRYHKSSSLDASGNLTAAARADTTLGDAHLKVAEATASSSGMSISPTWLGDHKIKIRCVVSVGNPLAPSVGGNEIDYDFEITIDYSNASDPRYSLEGDHDGFPAYEVYIGNNRIFQHDPLATGESLGSLFDPLEHDVNETTSHINQPLR